MPENLSFVIPAHNEEENIGKCLEAIFRELAGASAKAEIVVVNNASTDRTAEIARSYPSVRVVDEPHKGIVWARQAGYLASTGELIANVDADNILAKDWVKKVLREFEKDPKLAALSGPFIYYDLPRAINIFIKLLFYPITFIAYAFNRYILRGGAMLQGGNFILRREALQKINGYNTNIDFYGEDADVARRISKVGKVKFTFDLPIYSSGRRIAEEGAFTMGIRYGANYLSIMIFKKPLTQNSIDVRGNGNGPMQYSPKRKLREAIITVVTLGILLSIVTGVWYGIYRLAIFFILKR